MQSGRWVLVVVGALVACGDNRDAPHDGAVGADDADEIVTDGAVDAPPDGAPDAPPDGPADAGIDAAPRCGDGHLDPGEECDEGIEGLSGDGCSSTCTTEEMSWTNLTPNPAPKRRDMAIAYDSARHRIVLFGGSLAGYPTVYSNETWEWDGTTWLKKLTLVSPPARADHAMVFDRARQRIVLFGGGDANGALHDTWEWDGTTWMEIPTPTSPADASSPSLAYDPVRQVTVLWSESDGTWEYDGATWTQRTTTSPMPSSHTALVYAGSAGVMLISSTQNFLWDGSAWTAVSFAAQVPWGPTNTVFAIYDDVRDRVVAVASPGTEQYGLSVWEWTNGNWVRQQATSPGGPLTYAPAVAFDSARGMLVVFVGDEVPFNTTQTWDWDGSRWSEHYDSIPPPRTRPQVAYDARRARLFMFGGGGGREPFPTDTWEWDGSTWTLGTSPSNPPPRVGAKIAYDERRGVVVMYGGAGETFDADGNAQYASLEDTWEWNGASWQQRTPTTAPGPTNAIGNTMIYDRARGYILLFSAGQTWTWDGTAWTQLAPAHAPAEADFLTYDTRRDVALLYTRDVHVANLWEWNGTDWTDRGAAPLGSQILYDPLRGRGVLLRWDWYEDTSAFWTWDGTSWSASTPIEPYAAADKLFDPTTRSWFSFGDPGGWATWLARLGANDPHEQCDGSDIDGDGLTRCADPDCWWRCTPLCAPGDAYCDPNAPRCGDGTCSSIEDSALCPADCP
jgi:cysteine-rich repeat protein